MAWIRSIPQIQRQRESRAEWVSRSTCRPPSSRRPAQLKRQGEDEKGEARRSVSRTNDLFRHAVVNYGLAEAIRDGIVKKPIWSGSK